MTELRFLGTRGSCAAPFTDRSEYGGNTSCVSIRSGNRWLVLDAGTGIIPLAGEIRSAAENSPCSVKILISHFHLDHIVGLPMFLAALPSNVDVTLYAVPDDEYQSEEPYAAKLVSLIGPPLWPVKLTDVCGQLKLANLAPTTDNDIGEGISVRAIRSNHPNNASIFRISWNGAEIVYGLDCEITDAFEQTYVDFAYGCDFLLFDGAYTDEEYLRCVGFGHSSFSRSVDIAERTAAKQVFVLHFEYKYTDDMLSEAEKVVMAESNRIRFAREGQKVKLTTE